ncbi:uncharacterized protein LOC9646349 isoform X2 [Selaginella moellendorffii]|uniref:uncharacterized protein LOC9646349 isoform X2 n=1 Tax=Selaginella moellendorffii TaxID=88036 RepID=UPI000D1CD430|nr:uncharacterized protein LOC9646349 isoform X2 [Selaginella moellendorffii]|eukprot:XP_024536816.1 uncharacterized protein LOC9646349 isoform X2 [Selaginella moellendorffii]
MAGSTSGSQGGLEALSGCGEDSGWVEARTSCPHLDRVCNAPLLPRFDAPCAMYLRRSSRELGVLELPKSLVWTIHQWTYVVTLPRVWSSIGFKLQGFVRMVFRLR